MKRLLWLGFVLFVYLICSGCGDTFRPIIIPNPPTFPDPRGAHTVVSINGDEIDDNGTFVTLAGSAMAIDVSGDAAVSVKDVGLAPVHAVQQTANQVLVVNQAVTGLNVPTTSCLVTVPPTPPNHVFDVCSSITKLNFSGTSISSASTITLPIYSGANFVAVAPTDTLAYVTLPTYPPDPTQPLKIVPSVGVVNTQSNTFFTPPTPVGKNPVAIAVTPDKSKLYVANQGDGTISAFTTNAGNPSARTITGSLASAPIWLVARTDSQRVYVLEETSGTLASIDTTSTPGPDILTESTISVPGAITMVYDSNKNRLYIPGGPQMAIVDVAQSPLQLIATIAIPQVPGVPAVPANAVAVAALPDGSRAYVASVPSAAQSSQVSVSAVQGDGTTATYTYTLTGGHDLTPGITVAVSGIAPAYDGFNGTYVVDSVSNSVAGTTCDQAKALCTFQAANPTLLASQTAVTGTALSTVDNIFPQVTVVDVASNSIKSTISIPGFPDATNLSNIPYYAPACATARFRMTMAAAGDSFRIYLASCDGGNVNIIDTANDALNDTYLESLQAPLGSRPPIPPSLFNPPQNPVFLFAGP